MFLVYKYVIYLIIIIMASYTEEQIKYIEYNKKTNTKLLACAGSGKTRCIIARIMYLIENNVFTKDEILVLSFSRFTRDDFIDKINKISKKNIILKSSIKTIDSFAKSVIDVNGTIDVSLLSYKFMKYLENKDINLLKENKTLSSIKIVFVDEAQDLNEIQNNIFMYMFNRLNIIVNMIGDPNQNIFQFRKSSDKYLKEFDASTFILTKNFRSYDNIIDFSKYLRPFQEHKIDSHKGSNDCIPNMYFYKNDEYLEKSIIDILNNASENGIDLSEFAILSPTRGHMRNKGKSHGLCFVSNFLHRNNIKFKQFYEESNDGNYDGDGIKYSVTKGYVNLLTYMGSKGLEWNYVILIDADSCLINKNIFNENKHIEDRYLLYVACSRAIENMYIFSRCNFYNNELTFETNLWFKDVPKQYYILDTNYEDKFSFQNIKNRNNIEENNCLSKILDSIDYNILNKLSELIENRFVKQVDIYETDYSYIEKKSAPFLSKFLELLFYSLCNIKNSKKQLNIMNIENILCGDKYKIITNVSRELTEWYYINRYTDWLKLIVPDNLKQELNMTFDKTIPFKSHIILTNDYLKTYVTENNKWIKDVYDRYCFNKDYYKMIEIVFDITIIDMSIETQHYYHITQRGKKYKHILTNYKELFNELIVYVKNNTHNFIITNKIIKEKNISTKINIMDNTNIWNIKCTNTISLKHILHSLITSFLVSNKVCDIYFINLIKGEEITYSIDINEKVMLDLISTIV
uniref:UvrD-like helicase ATP-binding domain-containing protein n=1 Tax=viral metagenome TaxID=1070528 RepID=A0A6C0BDV6_9ZZZZ